MDKPRGSAAGRSVRHGVDAIAAYASGRSPSIRAMCSTLRKLIGSAMPKATSKVWHGSPVWFVDDNPVVGYSATARGVSLLFWNGRALREPSLNPVGNYGAAQAVFAAADEIDATLVRRWLKKARSNVFDSKTFFKKMRESGGARR